MTTRARILGDFNGCFGELLCVSHDAFGTTETGERIALREGMPLLVFEPDGAPGSDEAFLVATGTATRSPEELQCLGSIWSVLIDAGGIRHVSSLDAA